MKGRGEDWMAGDMVSPIIEGHSPRVGAVIRAEAGQSMCIWFKSKPTTILLTHRSVRSFDLTVMKDRFAKDQIAVGCPTEIVQRVVRVFGSESCQQ